MLEIALLASGSRGNAALVRTERASILLDAGLSARQICRRLEAVGEDPRRIAAVLVSHEHGDHVSGLRVLCKRFGTPVHATAGTRAALATVLDGQLPEADPIASGGRLQIEDLSIWPVGVSHDAAEPVGFVIEAASGERLGYATDLGVVTDEVRAALEGCELIVLEANHDRRMLLEGPYPWVTKQRVASRHGHLSNDHAAAALPRLLGRASRRVVLAHLSEQNNHVALARTAVCTALTRAGRDDVRVDVASQAEPTPLIRP
jgi:phosphoribosyl 1,2-cyclic phosphodiesterase